MACSSAPAVRQRAVADTGGGGELAKAWPQFRVSTIEIVISGVLQQVEV